MQTYEFIVVTTDNKIQRIIAGNIKGVLEAVDEDESPIVNIFRNNSVTQGGTYQEAVISTEVYPAPAVVTGCKAYPMLPVKTKQGEAIVLNANPTPGWKLEGWYCGDKLIGTEEQLTTIVTDAGNVIYTARFVPSI